MGDRAQVHIVANKEKEYNHDVWLYTHWGADAEYLTRIIFSSMIEQDVRGSTGYGIGNHQHGDVYRVITVDVDEQLITVDGWRDEPIQRSFADFAEQAFEVMSLP